MLRKSSFLSGVGSSLALAGATRIASAAEPASLTYPTRPVRWVVPYAPGGATDVMSRLVCQRLSQRLGRNFIVENKPGAGSNVGTEAVINSAHDGYTLLLTSTANAINASFDPSLRFDFAKAIVPVAGLAASRASRQARSTASARRAAPRGRSSICSTARSTRPLPIPRSPARSPTSARCRSPATPENLPRCSWSRPSAGARSWRSLARGRTDRRHTNVGAA